MYIKEQIRFSKIPIAMLQCINKLSITWLSTTEMAHACTRTHTHRWYGLLWHLMKHIRVTQCKFTVWHSFFGCTGARWVGFSADSADSVFEIVVCFCICLKNLSPIWFALAFLNVCTQIYFYQGRILITSFSDDNPFCVADYRVMLWP